MKKKILFFTISVAILISVCPIVTLSEEIDPTNLNEEHLQDEVMEQLHIDELQLFWKQLGDEYGYFINELQTKNLVELLKAEDEISVQSVVKGMITYLLYEITTNGRLMGTLIILTIISTIFQTMLNAFEKSTISKIVNFIIIIVLLYITLQSFYVAISYAKDTIHLMSDFIIALFPLMLGIIAALGQLSQVTFFHPIIIILIHFSSILLTKLVFPLLYIAALIIIISQLNDRFKATQLAQLFRSISLSALGMYLAIFLTILSIQGTVSAIQDGVALKTTKFIASNFIPVIGQTVTDAADTILSASLLIKNTLGVVGLLIIVLYAAFPAIKIAVLAFIYKLVAALLQPLAPKEMTVTLQVISQYMFYILACLLAMTFTFFLTIVIVVAASNIPILLR